MDAWSHLPGTIGDAWERMCGTSGDAWERLESHYSDAWERLITECADELQEEIMTSGSGVSKPRWRSLPRPIMEEVIEEIIGIEALNDDDEVMILL